MKNDFDQFLCKSCKRIRTDYYVCIDAFDSVSKTLKLGNGIAILSSVGSHPAQRGHSVELIEKIAAGRIALTSRSTGVPSIQPESDSAMDFQDRNLDAAPCLFHGIMDLYSKVDGQLESLPDWLPVMRHHGCLATRHWKYRF